MKSQQALQLAFQHLNGGNLGAAAQLFNGVLQDEPQNFAALNGRGFVALQQNALPQAQADLQTSLSINPQQPFAHKMLGIVLGAMGQFDSAMQAFSSALALDAKDSEVYFNRANFRFQAGQVQEALADLDIAIKLKDSYLEARSNRANLLIQLGEFARAEKDLDYLVTKVTNNPDLWVALGLARYKVGKYQDAMQCNERALRLLPNHPDALLNSSSAMHDQGEYPAALAWSEKAIAATPQRAEAHYAKAQALMSLQQFEDAIASYSKALEFNPNYVSALMGRGITRSRLRDFDGALDDYKSVEMLDPKNVELYNNLGIVYADQMLFDDAIAAYQKALVLSPENATAYGNLGVAYSACKNPDMAITAYNRALELSPTNYGVATNLSFALLAKGDFENGWRLFEARWKKNSHPRAFDKPLWLGREDLTNKKILLHAEQGFGDTIQFCRYVDELATKCKEVILLVQSPLEALCQTLSHKVKVVSEVPPMSDFDMHCPLMSLPLAVGTLETTIPARIPYLHADSSKRLCWEKRLDQYKGLKVGIVWSGGHHKDQPETWGVNARRNLPLRQLELLQMDGVHWISLQKGEEAEAELHQFNSQSHNGLNVIDWVADLKDYTDTAALIENLDLIISVDTSVAHLAGALGKPVWILNRFDSCWRWFLNRTDSPWYPTARIYNQTKPGDWDSVISEVNRDLQELIGVAK